MSLKTIGTIAIPNAEGSEFDHVAFDDHLLADIGLSRTTIEAARRSSLYQRAWRDSR
jgi:hypothetical protein